ncbi:ECF transporter S component [Holdemania filiformis]|uniref:ECF transporter S component n=1 Tax=Holdemania filiformis TaxID=61171 RepID=UPI0022E8B2F6|nr:ECF transporter S component [Holdemania filiformis]
MTKRTRTMAFIAIFAAINYVVFSYLKIDIPLAAGSSVAIHVANAIVVVSAFLLGPVEGGVAGAIGLSIADLLDPRYVASAPKTFFLKFCIGYLAGKVGQKLGLNRAEDSRQAMKIAAVSAAAGLGFNVIFDPIIGYLFKRFILGINAEAAAIILTWTGGVTAFNAVICVFVSVALYMTLRKPFASIYGRKDS